MEYFNDLKEIIAGIEASSKAGEAMAIDEMISKAIDLIIAQDEKGKKVMLIGNGGSASIASHIMTDLIKNAGIRALSFNDPSLITCISNDLGYEHVFEKPIEVCADEGDILIAISSSGRSENILRAAAAAKKKGLSMITLSGFSSDNSLRKMGGINFYVPSSDYGYVEIAHLAISHSIVDGVKDKRKPIKGE